MSNKSLTITVDQSKIVDGVGDMSKKAALRRETVIKNMAAAFKRLSPGFTPPNESEVLHAAIGTEQGYISGYLDAMSYFFGDENLNNLALGMNDTTSDQVPKASDIGVLN